MPSLADQIDDRPALLPTLQALQSQFRKLAAAQTATEQDGQDRSITLSGKSLPIGYLPERRRLARCKPIAQTRAQLADTFNAMDARRPIQGSTVQSQLPHKPTVARPPFVR